MSGRQNSPIRSLADFVIRYDLLLMQKEVKSDFSPEIGTQRLLKQSEISARFRKKQRSGS